MPQNQDPWLLASCTVCGVFWLIAYALIIRRGFLDKTYGMPLVPLCANISYEVLFGFVWPDDFPVNIVNMVWAAVDLVLVYQYLRFGIKEWPEHVPKKLFYPTFFMVLVMAATSIATITIDTNDYHGGNLTGWGAQLLLSAGSLYMLHRRNSPKGQSMYIVLFRMFGSLALIYGQETYERPFMFLHFVYVAGTLLDIIYLYWLARISRAHGLSPWALRERPRLATLPEPALAYA